VSVCVDRQRERERERERESAGKVCALHVCMFVCACVHYGVATVSRIDQIIGLFCKRAL